jgi:hypothetical protein
VKKLTMVACLLCLFAAMPALVDLYGGVGRWDRKYCQGGCGEFVIHGYQSRPFLSASASADETRNIKHKGSFEAFCLEADEWIAKPVWMIINTTWIDESMGVVIDTGSHVTLSCIKYGDNLDPGTVYLYTKFATGQLSCYVYAYSGIETVTTTTGQQVLATYWQNLAYNCLWTTAG